MLTSPVRSNLLAGTPLSVLSSKCILSVLAPPEEWDDTPTDLFEKLDVVRSVAQKVQESASSERPSIARPAREARELLKSHES